MPYTAQQLMKLSRLVSQILRHEPWLYELELDADGWISVDDLLAAIKQNTSRWPAVAVEDLVQIIAQAEKKRHEIKEGKIRALYGHSIPGKLIKRSAEPPEYLYHGTTPELIEPIQAQGLLPMGRHYVHLSVDRKTAQQVGKRKSTQPIILTIRANEAYQNKIQFYQGNDMIWLADNVPASFISFSD